MSHSAAPQGSRFFARLVRFDIACPRCDRVEAVGGNTPRSTWQPRLARYHCAGCGLVLYLGVVAWGAGGAAEGSQQSWETPGDWMPTVRHALELRRQLNVWAQTKIGRGKDRNVVAQGLPGVQAMPGFGEAVVPRRVVRPEFRPEDYLEEELGPEEGGELDQGEGDEPR